MKNLLVFISLVVMAALIAQLIKVPHEAIVRPVTLYIVAQMIFTAMCWIPFRHFGLDSLSYYRAFYGSMFFLAFASVVLSCFFLRPSRGAWIAWPLIWVCALFAAGIFMTFVIGLRRADMLNQFSLAQVASASAMLFCGALALASLAFPDGLVSDWIRVSMGAFWILNGLYYFSDVALHLRRSSQAIAALAAAPMIITIAVFSCLCLALAGTQKELSRQNTNSAAVEARGMGR